MQDRESRVTYVQGLFEKDHVDALDLGAEGRVHDDGVHLVCKLGGQQLRHVAAHELHLVLELELPGVLLGDLEGIVVDVQPDRVPAPHHRERAEPRARDTTRHDGVGRGERTRCP
jgi:hypothetical protein